ncbi:MAG: mechanosensitive ion channel family protein [Nitrososphaerales archaeon]
MIVPDIYVVTALQLSPLFNGLYTGFAAFLTQIFLFIPNLIAALIILLVGYLIVRAVVKALNYGVRRSNLETHVSRTNLGQTIERSGHSLSSIIVSTVKWLLYLIVVVYAISALSIAPLTASMLGVLGWIPNLIAVIIIVFAGALIASYVGKGIENTLPRYGVGGGRIVGLAVELLIYAIVFNFALIQIGFGQGILFMITTALSWGLAAALAIGFGVAIAYSLRGVLPPMISGATTITSTLKEGHRVRIEGIQNVGKNNQISGTVKSVGMFNTVIENEEGGFIVLPNSLLIDRPIMVDGNEAPVTMEQGLRRRISDIDEKFQDHMSNKEANEKSEPINR